MTLLRERRNKKALKLPSLPPPVPAAGFCRRALPSSPSSSSSSASSVSPSIDSLSDLEKLMILGHGNGGTVYKVRHRQTLALYALKVVRFGEEQAAACVEANILKQVNSQYIVRCHGVFDSHINRSADGARDDGDHVCFVMELMEVGSLHDVLLARRRLPEMAISVVARHVLQGLRYLHSIGIVHRDIKPSNLLINDKGEIKIADFGVSCRLNDTVAESYMGTCAYMSPERFDQERYNHSGGVDSWCTNGFAGDVWSLGVVVLECHVGRFPLISQGEKPDWVTLMCAVCFGEKKTAIPENASPEFRSFVWRCLEKDWRLRATVEELLSHPFVTKYYTCSGAAQELVGCS